MDIKLKLDFPVPAFERKLKHGDQLVLIGSCFSDEMGSCFAENGFDVLSNPFGTLFHPVPISRMILSSLQEDPQERIFQRNDLFFSWDASGTVFGFSEGELSKLMKAKKTHLKKVLGSAKYLFITFGSAFGYVEKDLEEIISNCHKMPTINFDKSLTYLELMYSDWSKTLDQLHQFNPELQIVFTVSPVRHVKDGLVENNRSKARLFELINQLEEHPFVHYFPSYEIMLDELRDYRFYKTDGIHPNEQAIQYIWEQLKRSVLSTETQKLCKEVISFRKLERHHPLYEGSKEAASFEENKKQKLKYFLEKHPEVVW